MNGPTGTDFKKTRLEVAGGREDVMKKEIEKLFFDIKNSGWIRSVRELYGEICKLKAQPITSSQVEKQVTVIINPLKTSQEEGLQNQIKRLAIIFYDSVKRGLKERNWYQEICDLVVKYQEDRLETPGYLALSRLYFNLDTHRELYESRGYAENKENIDALPGLVEVFLDVLDEKYSE